MTKLVGILNLTPDSFSDGGKLANASEQIAALERLIEEGADVIDIGAESTRPGATPLSAAEEWQRLIPFFAALEMHHLSVPLSLDTRHPENAKRALDKGFSWINDVSGYTHGGMLDAVGGYDCTLVAMHSLSIPADKNITLAEDADVTSVLANWMLQMCEKLAGKNIILDPGIGFGKTPAQSWHIIEHIDALQALGIPLLIGHSRKSFLATVDRDAATISVSRGLIAKNIDYLRVHDVKSHKALL